MASTQQLRLKEWELTVAGWQPSADRPASSHPHVLSLSPSMSKPNSCPKGNPQILIPSRKRGKVRHGVTLGGMERPTRSKGWRQVGHHRGQVLAMAGRASYQVRQAHRPSAI
jgi:hypothetical protein